MSTDNRQQTTDFFELENLKYLTSQILRFSDSQFLLSSQKLQFRYR